MAVTLVTTVKGENSNSYASIAEADAYFEPIAWFWTIWNGLTTEQKSSRLITATRSIDSRAFLSTKVASAQALEFPRSVQEDTTVIPEKVKRAQLEMVLYEHVNLSATGQQAEQIDRVDVYQAVEVEFRADVRNDAEKAIAQGSLSRIEQLLSEWLVGSDQFPIVV